MGRKESKQNQRNNGKMVREHSKCVWALYAVGKSKDVWALYGVGKSKDARILLITYSVCDLLFHGYPCKPPENIMLQCLKKYGNQPTDK